MKNIYFFIFALFVLYGCGCKRADISSTLSGLILNYSVAICQKNNGLVAIKTSEPIYVGRGSEYKYYSDISIRCGDGAVFLAQVLDPNTEKERIIPK